jgi:hypothetical protein
MPTLTLEMYCGLHFHFHRAHYHSSSILHNGDHLLLKAIWLSDLLSVLENLKKLGTNQVEKKNLKLEKT